MLRLRRAARATTATTCERGVLAEVRRGRRRLPPAGLGLEADPLRDRVRRSGSSRRAASCSTSPPSSTAARTGRRATPTSSTAARCWSARRSSTRSTSRPSGRSSGWATSRRQTGGGARASASPAAARRSSRRAGRRARDRRGQAARPHRGLRRARQRRRRNPAADDPRDRGPTGTVVRQAPEPEGTAARQRAGRVPRHRHPRRQHRPAPEPDLGREAGALQRPNGEPPPGGGQDRHRE